jgi:hypothetical protein
MRWNETYSHKLHVAAWTRILLSFLLLWTSQVLANIMTVSSHCFKKCTRNSGCRFCIMVLYNCISSLMLVLQYHRCKWLYKIQLPEKSLFFFHHFLRTWAWQFLLNIMVFSSSYWKICYWYFYMASMLQTYNTTFQTLDPSWVLNFSVHC